MAASDVREDTKDSMKITGKLESGDGLNSTCKMSAQQSSILY